MGKFLLWVVILVMVVNTLGCLGCLEEERIALLHVKTHIMNNTYGNSLVSWVVEDKMSDCCKWSRVRCSNITRRVIELHLDFVRDESVGNWYIDATIFLPFKHLNYLYLSENNIAGVVENGGFEKLSKLRNLKGLDLSYNNLNRNILSSLSHLLSLKELYLDENPLDSPHNNSGHERLSGLNNLEFLSMSYTEMEENNVLSALNLKDFISLKDLDISGNKFQSFELIKALNTLLKLYSLEVFSVAYNNLTGAIPGQNAQFGTFDESSYEGNPYLCGPPLQVSCNNISPLPTNTNGESEESNSIDMEVFYISFGVSYVVFLLGIVLVLYINPYWRNTWFKLIESIVHKWQG